jgi:hypothetical protein
MLPCKMLTLLFRTESFPKIEMRQSRDRARNDRIADRVLGTERRNRWALIMLYRFLLSRSVLSPKRLD